MSEPNSTVKLRGVLYARKSNEDDGASVEQQKEWAAAAARREGVEVVASFADQSVAGHDTVGRTGFHEMLEFCRQEHRRKRPVDAVVCWNSNRFSRSDSQETAWYVWELRKVGVGRMLTSNAWVDFADDTDRLVFNIYQDTTNHKYVKELARDVLRGKIKAAREGRPPGGVAPFGYAVEYAWDANKRKQRPVRLVIDPEKADVVRWMYAEYASGRVSLWGLAQLLDKRGIKPPGKSPYWNATGVAVILRNEVYLGQTVWNRRTSAKFFGVIDGVPAARNGVGGRQEKVAAAHQIRGVPHEAVIDRDLWDAVQLQLARRRKLTTPRMEHDFRLTGLLTCGACGAAMLGRHKPLRGAATRGTHERYFLCGNYSRYGLRACNRNGVAEDGLFAALAKKLKAELLNEDTVARLRREVLLQAGKSAPSERERDRLASRVAETERLISVAARKVIAEEVPAIADACRQEIVKLTEERDQLRAALEEMNRRPQKEESPTAMADRVEQRMRRFDKALTDGDPAEVRAVLGELIDRVELFFDHSGSGRGMMCSFARGLVYLREDSDSSHLPTTSGPACGAG
jgi:DNA invertase Pin-like site-specific DNA recombinase